MPPPWKASTFLPARLLDEIPGTFCQYMRIDETGSTLRIEYRRARRGGIGAEVAGRRIAMANLPTCRMVTEAGRTVVFRDDDPERAFCATEAMALFGARPQSVLMIPVLQQGRCTALLAVGEMRDVRRHTYSVSDRRFADSFSRLHTLKQRTRERSVDLEPFGDLNLTFSSPLTGILGSVEILRQESSAGPQNKYLDVIERNAARIRETVTQLADYTVPQRIGS